MYDDMALLMGCQAKQDENHLKQFGPNPKLEARAERHRAKAAAYQELAWLRQRAANLAKRPDAPPVDLTATRTAPRARGAGRPAARRAAGARSGSDPGDEGPSDEPPRRRLCAHCGGEIPDSRGPRALYCEDKCSQNARKARERAREYERNPKPRSGPTHDERRMFKFEPGELERLLLYAVCRCNGHHILERDSELGHRCCKCGRQTPGSEIGRGTLLRLGAVVA
jgi:hypothetical protein